MTKWSSFLGASLIVLCQCLLVLSGPRFKRVSNGRNAMRGEVPYQVRIFYPDDSSCGGVIIDYFYVLSASHCFRNRTFTEAKVETAIINIDEKLWKVNRNVQSLITYKNKDDNHYAADIVLVKVDVAFPKGFYKDWVKPIQLQLNPDYIGKDCYVSGWGTTGDGKEALPHLQVAKVDMFSREECINKYKHNKKMSADLFCAADVEKGRDACQGDSGGPLVCDGYLTGLVKGGIDCGHKYYPGKYTNVAVYADWIASVLKKKPDHIGRS